LVSRTDADTPGGGGEWKASVAEANEGFSVVAGDTLRLIEESGLPGFSWPAHSGEGVHQKIVKIDMVPGPARLRPHDLEVLND
jgi:hypothetical protein